MISSHGSVATVGQIISIEPELADVFSSSIRKKYVTPPVKSTEFVAEEIRCHPRTTNLQLHK